MNIDKYVSENSEFLKLLFEQLPANIFYKNLECRYQFVSNICCQILDTGEDDTLVGKTDLEVQKDKELGKFYYEDDLKIIRTGEGSSYVNEIDLDGELRYYKIEKRPIKERDGKVIGIVGIVNDITELTLLSKELEVKAQTDAMTGLYNRAYLEKWIVDEMREATYPITIILADCNRLKEVNDTYGHEQGDELICATANILNEVLPEDSVVCRMGGDEFLAICQNMSSEVAEQMVEQLKEQEKSVPLQGRTLSISYGIYTMEKADENFARAYKVADANMYENKKNEKRRN